MNQYIPSVLKSGTLDVGDVAALKTILGAGAPANTTTISVCQEAVGLINKTTLTLASFSVSVVGATGVGFGGAKLYDFPEGALCILGTTANLSFNWAASAGPITLTGSGDFGIGSTLNAGTTLATTEVDIVPSSPMETAAVAGVARGVGRNTAILYLDGTTTAADAILNVLIDDANIAETDIVLVSGTIIMVWINLGDYTAIT